MGAKEERQEAEESSRGYEATWFSHQRILGGLVCVGVDGVSKVHGPRVWHSKG